MGIMSIVAARFYKIKDLYSMYNVFKCVFGDLMRNIYDHNYHIMNKLCIPSSSLRDFLIKKLYSIGIGGYFGWYKILSLIIYIFF